MENLTEKTKEELIAIINELQVENEKLVEGKELWLNLYLSTAEKHNAFRSAIKSVLDLQNAHDKR